jgi:hypothetical protein
VITAPEAERTGCDLMFPQEERAQSLQAEGIQQITRTSNEYRRFSAPRPELFSILPPPGIKDDQGILHVDTLRNPSRCRSPSFASAIQFV